MLFFAVLVDLGLCTFIHFSLLKQHGLQSFRSSSMSFWVPEVNEFWEIVNFKGESMCHLIGFCLGLLLNDASFPIHQ